MENFSKKLIQLCVNKELSISIAESCTGGMIVSKLISIPGASKVIDCGIVTYSNKAKQIYLDVPEFDLQKYGAVSKQVAELMINGLKNKNNSDIYISTTGIAGPEGGSKKKPVGTVFHSFYINKKAILTIKNFYEGNRYNIRLKASMFSINETFKKLSSII
jgi:nicotinamide-nucleotide amidase